MAGERGVVGSQKEGKKEERRARCNIKCAKA